MGSWADRVTVKKGDLAETIVNNYILRKGHIPYRPVTTDKAHPFDWICATPDKRVIYVADAKAKPARLHYPDTGIDISHYTGYQHIHSTYHLRVFLFFVDEMRKVIEGGFLDHISKNHTLTYKGRILKYPIRQNGIIYFPLELMQKVSDLTESEATALSSYSSRSAEYDRQYAMQNQATPNPKEYVQEVVARPYTYNLFGDEG